jgi:PII-like signaling protein
LEQLLAHRQHTRQVLPTEITQYLDLSLPVVVVVVDRGTAMQAAQEAQAAVVAQDQMVQDQTDLQAQMTAEIKILADEA